MEKDGVNEGERREGWGIVEILGDSRVMRLLARQAETLKSTDAEKEMGFEVYRGKKGAIRIVEMREVEADSVQLGLAGAVAVSRLREQGYMPVADVHFHTSSGEGVYGAGAYALSAADLVNLLDEQERFRLSYKRLIPIVGVMAMARGEKVRLTVYQVDKPSIAKQARIMRDYHRLSDSDRSVGEMQETLAIFGFRMEVVEYDLASGLGEEEREKLASFRIA